MVKKKKYAVAVDIGATNLRVALGNKKGNLIEKVKEKTRRKGDSRAIAKQIIKTINSLEKPKKISAIGIGAMGPLDLKKGAKIKPINHPLKTIDLTPIAKEFKIPTFVLNDCNAGVLGEQIFGAGKKLKNLIYITFSTGLGAGAIANGCLILGKGGNGMEAGHMVVDPQKRMRCDCGKRGHWEAYSSAQDMPKFFKIWKKENNKKNLKNFKGKITAELIFKKAAEGDKTALDFLDKIGRINALSFANLINIFNTSLITVGGAMALNNKSLLLKPLKKYLKDYNYNPIPKIQITSLGDDIVLLGALAAAFNKQGFKIKY